MASGYGRGGRGAALLAALNEPVRKPGESPQTGDQKVEQRPVTLGRGASMLQAAQQMQSAVPSTTATPQPGPSASAMPKPMGRGQMLQAMQAAVKSDAPSPTVPMGRSALLTAAVSQVPAPVPGMPIGRGALAMHMRAVTSPVSPLPGSSPQPTAPSPQVQTQRQAPVASPQEPPKDAQPMGQAGTGEGQGDERISKLEYMLKDMELEKVTRKGTSGVEIPLCANYIPVKCKNAGVYQYAVSFSPSVDSRNMRNKLLWEHISVTGTTRAFDGAILFLPIKLPEAETVLKSNRPTDDQEITMRIKLTRVLPPQSCVQLYNVVFRRIYSHLKMCQVGRQYYDPHRPAPVPQHKLEVWPGYVTAVDEYEGGLMMLTDVSHRVLRTETILDIMGDAIKQNPQNFKKIITEKVLGKTVLTRYNNKTYSVDDILWDKNPMSSFETAPGEHITYVDYYMKNYSKKIQDVGQPLLVHKPKPKERERGRKQLDLICLIPELCYITGLTDEIRADFRIMKDLASHTRISPAQRQQSLRKFCENVNSHPEARAELEKWGLELDMDTIQIMGRKFPEEKILLMSRGEIRGFPAGPKADWGNKFGREQVLQGVPLKNWLVVYCKRNANNALDFMQMMQQVCPQMGWSVERPVTVELPNDRTETYLGAIRTNMTAQTQCVVAIFPTSRDDRYNAFKKLCCVEAPVPSQVINDRTLSKRNKKSIVEKVALQINAKLGGELWGVSIPVKHLMVCGIDTYHAPGNKRNSIGGFVASMNQHCSRWYSRVCHQTPGQELIDGLKVCFLSALRKYYEVNHTLPERIIVFRDGVGDGQLRVVASHEVEQLKSCFPSLGESYDPKLGVVVVQKRINTRLFAVSGQGRNVKLDNPPPGTVMDHTVTRRDKYDFFLVSQYVTQGTVTPTHYVVVHDGTGWPPDRIQALSYKMTHMYYNWCGTVRVPAPCQYAHKLAGLVGQSIHKDPAVELADRLFYL